MLLFITDSFQNNERPKTIFIMKQDIRRYIYIYVAYSLPGWTDWAEIFLWTLRGGRGCCRLKNSNLNFFSFTTFFPHGKRRVLQLVLINRGITFYNSQTNKTVEREDNL